VNVLERATSLAACLAALLVAACQQSISSSIPPAASLSVVVFVGGTATHSVSLSLNDTVRVSATASDIFSHPLPANIAFASRNALVASVSGSGLIRALGNGTTYVVGATAGGGSSVVRDSVKVQVTVICTAIALPALVIAVQDSVTGSKGPFTNVSYVARGLAGKDSTFLGSVPAQVGGFDFRVGLAYERADTYDVTVTASNYKPWVKPGVTVTKDACHVITMNLTARLVAQ
jgi:hypothetical protein